MPRNLERRIEVVFPIEDGILRDRIINEVIATSLEDNVKAKFLDSKGGYSLVERRAGQAVCRSQGSFMKISASTHTMPGEVEESGGFPKMKLAKRPAE